jgi:membrane-associated phospholipid phosphatase
MAYLPTFIDGTTAPVVMILVGLSFFLFGMGHLHPILRKWDESITVALNGSMRTFSRAFVYLWHLGTSPVAVLLVAFTFISGFRVGLVVAVFYLGLLMVERFIKEMVKRHRPFVVFSKVPLTQPIHPVDPSFPSGDAMRVVYLALLIPTFFYLHWIILVLAGFAALILCIGRIALGVHYLLDVLGGVGLGFIGAGCVLLYL